MKHVKIFTIILFLAIISSAQCTKDIECKGDRICVDGHCIDENSSVESDQSPSLTSNQMGGFSIYTQPLGFLQMGPVVGTEIRLIKNLLFDFHFRYSAMGLAYVAIATEGFEEDLKMSSMGFGTGLRYFFHTSGPHNPYIGSTFEVDLSAGEYDDDYEWGEWEETAMGIMINGGYRWRFNPKFFLGIGGSFGVMFITKYDEWYTSDGLYKTVITEPDDDTFVLAMLELSLGWEFGKQ